MKLFELIKPRTGFSPYPNQYGLYTISKNCSVKFSGETLPKDTDQGNWEFKDESNFVQNINDTFKSAIKKATNAHKQSKGSSFSHTLNVIKK